MHTEQDVVVPVHASKDSVYFFSQDNDLSAPLISLFKVTCITLMWHCGEAYVSGKHNILLRIACVFKQEPNQ